MARRKKRPNNRRPRKRGKKNSFAGQYQNQFQSAGVPLFDRELLDEMEKEQLRNEVKIKDGGTESYELIADLEGLVRDLARQGPQPDVLFITPEMGQVLWGDDE